ncbi:efflux RND transporter periplasmic adaptor subunit [Sphingomonas sp. BN140010]|uniref:Efflux RND transporter periplasmic adaptor subunit n=1 Tax=Sphingomonas arvum TaxID=2992113 RepID=A0ABT3JEU6_9SPHN|nr:efflux RND transporter periplasmic adaptor subunit [Sphingomonas sp. BN140010]MCW3797578.1 efflux RND transporter periplasmic adaptor subunit [Sphingomonas sp. BN140010]
MLAGCGSEQSAAQGQGQGRGRGGPTQVGFVVVSATAVPVINQLGGRTVAFETSEVRPQVGGLVQRRLFTEGSYVKQGQPLYQIDPSLYRASVNEANANVASARAAADAAQARANRYRPLAQIEAISQQDYTDAAAQARQARAAVAQNNAALETARINLRFATVRAPISGRIGRSLFTQGALVSSSQADPLAVIQRTDPIFVDIQQSSADLTTLRRALSTGGANPGSTQVRLLLEDGSDYGYTGTVQFSEATVNESTGTVTLRARFPNPNGVLLPGSFVQARFTQAVTPNAILVPQSALQRDIGGQAYVFIVGPGNKALRRGVAADRTFGTDWVITGGLRPGDKVITQGLANLRNNAPIRPVPASTPQKIAPPPPGSVAAGGRSGGGGGGVGGGGPGGAGAGGR